MAHSILLLVLSFLSSAVVVSGQLDIIWRLGLALPRTQCNKVGTPSFGLSDPWLFSVACNTFGGSVGCITSNDPDRGICGCNQGNDTAFELTTTPRGCLGKVGAICTVGAPRFIPEKRCFPNAECVPDQQGEGRVVGTCQCMYGYKEDENTRKCVREDGVDLTTVEPVTVTTEEPVERGRLELPLGLLLGMRYTAHDTRCHSNALLNKTYCNTHLSTVSCLENKCQCNMIGEADYNNELNVCLGLTGSYCLTRPSLLGPKACVDGAYCVVEEGTTEDLYSFGICRCLYGYIEQEDGTCTRDASISDPSTKKPWPTTSTPPAGPDSTDDPEGGGSAAVQTVSFILLSIGIIINKFY